MKKSLFVLLAVLVLGSLALAGCGEAEQPTTTVAPATTLPPETTTTAAPTTTTAAPVVAPSAPIPYTEALDYEGQTVTVTGPVVGIRDMGEEIEKVLIQIGSTEDGEGFNAMVMYENRNNIDIDGLMGKTVNVTGEIYVTQFQLKGEVELTDPSQLVIVG